MSVRGDCWGCEEDSDIHSDRNTAFEAEDMLGHELGGDGGVDDFSHREEPLEPDVLDHEHEPDDGLPPTPSSKPWEQEPDEPKYEEQYV